MLGWKLVVVAVLSAAARLMVAEARPSLSEPTISPDGREIVFVSGGDLWSVAAAGGEAHLLVSHPATESRPMFSPDGTRLAFVSTRTGGGDIYVLTFATGALERMTYTDALDQMEGWSADGRWLYFSSAVNDIAGQTDIFRVSSAGGTPLEVSRERYLAEFEAAPSPDGQAVALIARGLSNRQWWRNGHSHIDETELWVKPVAGDGGYRRVLTADAKHGWPMWSADGTTILFMSDASGAENLWAVPAGGTNAEARAVTHFTSGRVLWPSMGDHGKTIVFERDLTLWSCDVASGKAHEVPVTLRGVPSSPGVTHRVETKFSELAVSPDGNKLAVIAHGEVFAAGVKDGGEAERITHTAAAESAPVWSPDSTKLVYLSERNGRQQIFGYDFVTARERALTDGAGDDGRPTWSPDGKSVAFVRDRKQLHVLTLGTGDAAPKDAVVARAAIEEPRSTWSPDSQWIAFTTIDGRSFSNVMVVARTGGEARPVTSLANGETGSRVAWSPDGRYLLVDTAQRSETVQIARVDLLPHVPKYREDEFRELFQPGKTPGTPTPSSPLTPEKTPAPETPTTEPQAPVSPVPASSIAKAAPEGAAAGDKKKPEPVRIVFDGLRERLTLLPLGLSATDPVISPDGKVLLFSATVANEENLYTYSLDELAKEPAVARQLTSTAGDKDGYGFTPDSKTVIYLEDGGVRTIALEGRQPKPIAVSATMDVDFDLEKRVVFEEAWSTINRTFFDPKFNGQDWRGLHDRWLPWIEGARTPDEVRRDVNLMIGELNASHSGISNTAERNVPPRAGNLGLRFDRTAYEAGKGLVVREVIALGPAAIEGTMALGDRLVSVNGTAVGEHTNLDALLEDTIGHRVVLGVERAGKMREVVVRPVSGASATGLLYRQWVESRRRMVGERSGGKLGYVHLADMSDGSLRQLYLDLDAENESRQGVVVDVRNNNGGYVNGYVLDVFSRRNYLTMTPRDLFPIPSRQALGQRALGVPTVLVTNESSLSDAEDFTEGYRSLGLGKVVGEPTAGWIIFTGGERLIDGSAVRTPSTRIDDGRGQGMELHPRPVDVEVERPLGETETERDAQLERAVDVLMATGSGR